MVFIMKTNNLTLKYEPEGKHDGHNKKYTINMKSQARGVFEKYPETSRLSL